MDKGRYLKLKKTASSAIARRFGKTRFSASGTALAFRVGRRGRYFYRIVIIMKGTDAFFRATDCCEGNSHQHENVFKSFHRYSFLF
jgi:hypothetical protein